MFEKLQYVFVFSTFYILFKVNDYWRYLKISTKNGMYGCMPWNDPFFYEGVG